MRTMKKPAQTATDALPVTHTLSTLDSMVMAMLDTTALHGACTIDDLKDHNFTDHDIDLYAAEAAEKARRKFVRQDNVEAA